MIINFIKLFNDFKESSSKKSPNLTEERIYHLSNYFITNKNLSRVPVFSGSIFEEGVVGYVPNLITKEEYLKHKEEIMINTKKINYYKNNKDGCITIVADGVYAGYSFYRSYNKYPLFCMNISCTAFFLRNINEIKEDYPDFDGLNLEWFEIKFHNQLKNLLRGEGVKHFTKTIYKELEFEIPNLPTQEKELKELLKLHKIKKRFYEIKGDAESLLLEEVNGFAIKYQDSWENIFNTDKGTMGFTEEMIYRALPVNTEKKYGFFGGEKTHKIPTKYVSPNAINNHGKKVAYFNGECLILSMDGSAGNMTYKDEKSEFTLNHHAGCVTLKEKYRGKVNLKWFKYQYEKMLIDSAVSKKSSRTLSKTILNGLIIYLPKEELQDERALGIEDLENLNIKMDKIKEDIEELLDQEIISN